MLQAATRARDWLIARLIGTLEGSMAIDNCTYTFAELAAEVLPRYMAELRKRMTSPHPMAGFAREGVGVRSLLQRFQLEDDFRGCYVLMNAQQPVYVGISQGVLQRLRQHVRGVTHFDASLAYRMAATRRPHGLTRSGAMVARASSTCAASTLRSSRLPTPWSCTSSRRLQRWSLTPANGTHSKRIEASLQPRVAAAR